jgi:hypothetical protein
MSTVDPATPVLTSIEAAIEAIIAHYKALAVNGLSLSELFTLATSAAASLVSLFTQNTTLTAAEIETAITLAAGTLYDSISPLIVIPFVPPMVEAMLAQTFKPIFLNVVNGAVVSLLSIFSKLVPTPAPVTTKDFSLGITPEYF